MSLRTWVYIDAFNLYYGCLKGTPYRWLDLHKMCSLLLPKHRIEHIKYFTARVSAWPTDKNKPVRQQTYLRALQSQPKTQIIYGHFLTHIVQMPLANPGPLSPRFVKVVKMEEKGSDVNLATHLVNDGYRGCYENAVVITNDSDLLEPVKVVIRDLGITVGVLNPQEHPCKVLKREATFFKKIRHGVLRESQFPSTMTDQHGTFHKPKNW